MRVIKQISEQIIEQKLERPYLYGQQVSDCPGAVCTTGSKINYTQPLVQCCSLVADLQAIQPRLPPCTIGEPSRNNINTITQVFCERLKKRRGKSVFLYMFCKLIEVYIYKRCFEYKRKQTNRCNKGRDLVIRLIKMVKNNSQKISEYLMKLVYFFPKIFELILYKCNFYYTPHRVAPSPEPARACVF